jgi:hypothetical protein
MTVALTVRNVPEDVRDELAARAARSGRSMQEFLLAQLNELTAIPSAADVIARARSRAAATGSWLSPESIVAARNAERR